MKQFLGKIVVSYLMLLALVTPVISVPIHAVFSVVEATDWISILQHSEPLETPLESVEPLSFVDYYVEPIDIYVGDFIQHILMPLSEEFLPPGANNNVNFSFFRERKEFFGYVYVQKYIKFAELYMPGVVSLNQHTVYIFFSDDYNIWYVPYALRNRSRYDVSLFSPHLTRVSRINAARYHAVPVHFPAYITYHFFYTHPDFLGWGRGLDTRMFFGRITEVRRYRILLTPIETPPVDAQIIETLTTLLIEHLYNQLINNVEGDVIAHQVAYQVIQGFIGHLDVSEIRDQTFERFYGELLVENIEQQIIQRIEEIQITEPIMLDNPRINEIATLITDTLTSAHVLIDHINEQTIETWHDVNSEFYVGSVETQIFHHIDNQRLYGIAGDVLFHEIVDQFIYLMDSDFSIDNISEQLINTILGNLYVENVEKQVFEHVEYQLLEGTWDELLIGEIVNQVIHLIEGNLSIELITEQIIEELVGDLRIEFLENQTINHLEYQFLTDTFGDIFVEHIENQIVEHLSELAIEVMLGDLNIEYLGNQFIETILENLIIEYVERQYIDNTEFQFIDTVWSQLIEYVENQFFEFVEYHFHEHFYETTENHFHENISNHFHENIYNYFSEFVTNNFHENIVNHFNEHHEHFHEHHEHFHEHHENIHHEEHFHEHFHEHNHHEEHFHENITNYHITEYHFHGGYPGEDGGIDELMLLAILQALEDHRRDMLDEMGTRGQAVETRLDRIADIMEDDFEDLGLRLDYLILLIPETLFEALLDLMEFLNLWFEGFGILLFLLLVVAFMAFVLWLAIQIWRGIWYHMIQVWL